MKNIVLIGMPGSGKTTIGKLLAEELGMSFIDMDDYIQKTEQKSIKVLFAQGESFFRDAETRCAEELSKLNSYVIAAGGGIVVRKENLGYLKKSSIIVFINRKVENIISDIDCETRPLLAEGAERLYKLYNDRIKLYKSYCHIEIPNNESAAAAVSEIIKKIH